MRAPLESLVPRPRRIESGAGALTLGEAGVIAVAGAPDDLSPALRLLRHALGPGWQESGARASPPAGVSCIRLRLVPRADRPQSYRLCVTPAGVEAEAQDRAGLFYAAVTLAQLIGVSGGVLPACEIEDAPDFEARGVMLDISRDKVPTMDTLFGLVDMLAGLKVNQFQLYTEHTFAYRGHEAVWRDATPMTPEEIRELDAYCRKRCVELVPNQNSFGHLERWLALPRYAPLAELPQGGAPLPWGGVHERPTSLCPTDPRSLALLEDLYDQLLPNFTSRLFNVGCDETFDLRGEGRSAAQVRAHGEGHVYLDFLKEIHARVTARGRRMAFWGDIIIRHPELVREVPFDALALEWGYEADHPFDAHGALFAASGLPFYVCPGTSSWNSLAGRTANMRANLVSAAENGLRHGACGYLVTDWGDGGHWQPLAVSLAGYVYGAALAWGGMRNRGLDLAQAMNLFGGAQGHGDALLRLGDLYLRCGALRGNASELFLLLAKPRGRALPAGITTETLRDVLGAADDIARALPAEQASVVGQEVCHVIRLLRAACRRGIALLDGSIDAPAARMALAAEQAALMAAHASVWRLRNREGGLSDSLARMERGNKQ
ncbi:MAG TPA: family 20 glycosylhydrolase [Kiritimatiellia bacterium]|nr:family 20 glycosylhydrolase [Kiritimatiellia bacterium]HQA37761.1 family 20 glycosylhydrolase [Kiritimatiellia bacterium]HQQ90488.1 family 20 glycosylhydrolase [Kiritimatiellia bacterium]